MTQLISLLLLSLNFIQFANAYPVEFSLKDTGTPANDLQNLTREQAWTLKKNNGDLTKIDPVTTDFWNPQAPVRENQFINTPIPTLEFKEVISGVRGRFRFRVHSSLDSSQIYTVMMSRTLHTYLLRKAFLEKLGYRLPPIQYAQKIKIKFKDQNAMDEFVKIDLPYSADADPDRWVIEQDDAQSTVTLQDVALMPQELGLYYLAPPIQMITRSDGSQDYAPESSRVLRLLGLVYAITDLPEGIEKMTWDFGRRRNQKVHFNTPEPNEYTLTLDDAIWLIEKIRTFSRSDFEAIGKSALLPTEVERMVTEKIISRVNSLAKSMRVPELAFQANTKLPAIEKKAWPGYASDFSSDDPISPFDQMQYFAYSSIQSNLARYLFSKANQQLPALNTREQRERYRNLFYSQGKQLFRTGQAAGFKLGAWAAPLAGGNLSLSRDVVLGNYLGTNHLVQLADSFNLSGRIGLLIGFEGLPKFLSAEGMAQLFLNFQITHIKPVVSLKDAFKEPLKNQLVLWLLHKASRVFRKIGEGGTQEPPLRDSEIADLLATLKKYLGNGESLIITQSITDQESLGINAGVKSDISIFAGVNAGRDGKLLRRIHLYRKSTNVFQVFIDRGKASAGSYGTGATVLMPVTTLSLRNPRGKTETQFFELDLSPNLKENPNLFVVATGLNSLLKTGSGAVLKRVHAPTLIETRFKDRASHIQALPWIRRTLNTRSEIQVTLPKPYTQGSYLYFTQGKQRGRSIQSLATQFANSLVAQFFEDSDAYLATQSSPNPGQSVYGRSKTRESDFQSHLNSERHFFDPFVKIRYRWEGWNLQIEKINERLQQLHARYRTELIPENAIIDTESIRFYSIQLDIRLYEQALSAIRAISDTQRKEIVKRYRRIHHCALNPKSVCAAITHFSNQHRRLEREPTNQSIQTAKLLYRSAQWLEEFMDFKEFLQIIGGPDALYLDLRITGWREGSKNKSTPIYSHSIGTLREHEPEGAILELQEHLGIPQGEFDGKWLRQFL